MGGESIFQSHALRDGITSALPSVLNSHLNCRCLSRLGKFPFSTLLRS
jgi:hypothetical protein